jgi:hypothetical protein
MSALKSSLRPKKDANDAVERLNEILPTATGAESLAPPGERRGRDADCHRSAPSRPLSHGRGIQSGGLGVEGAQVRETGGP